jgi:hypothetical protein
MTGRKPSAVRLREKLAASGNAARIYQTEALYHTEVEWTCRLLYVVDEIADPAAADRITDAICERLAGNSTGEAAERIWQVQAGIERLMASAPDARRDGLI